MKRAIYGLAKRSCNRMERIETQRTVPPDPPLIDQCGSGPRRSVLVIGAGVSGLTTALCLGRKGFQVTVVADQFAPRVTSVVAGALWEWPPAVCGLHQDQVSLTRSKAWCETSYDIFTDLAQDPATGVFVRPVTFYFKRPIAEDPQQQQKMDELKGKVRGFRHDAALVGENGVSPGLGLRDAYTHLTPMVDTDTYMGWLQGEAQRAGCRLLQRTITGPLRPQAEALAQEYGTDVIVNCTGLGAGELAEETVYPVRGALIRVRLPPRKDRFQLGRLAPGAGLHFHRAARPGQAHPGRVGRASRVEFADRPGQL
jgi:D-amino-acid oxidase